MSIFTEQKGKCPNCGSTHIEFLEEQLADNTDIDFVLRCSDCETEFLEHYELIYKYTENLFLN